AMDDKAWLCVDLRPVRALFQRVPLAVIRTDPALAKMALLRQTRLSVVPLTPAEFARVLELGDRR
ncbi:MAG: EVE domain-containing protein, partial [Verrucomicrobia bacterium]|nr:EVE domain-containing protein [Verrucomicrobiota bacterium]